MFFAGKGKRRKTTYQMSFSCEKNLANPLTRTLCPFWACCQPPQTGFTNTPHKAKGLGIPFRSHFVDFTHQYVCLARSLPRFGHAERWHCCCDDLVRGATCGGFERVVAACFFARETSLTLDTYLFFQGPPQNKEALGFP